MGLDVFLSYAVLSDYRFVRELEAFLESFHRTPTLSSEDLRPIQACVDGSDFRLPNRQDWQRWAAEKEERRDAVWRTIETHLQRCKYLLVLGSLAAARSEWVNEEVRWFLANRGPAAVLLGLSPTLEGSPIEPSEVFPPSVIEADLPRQTIWFDFRGKGRDNGQPASVRDYFEERVRLAAELSEKTLGELLPGWYRNERKAARRRLTGVVTIALLALGMTAGGLLWRLAAHRAMVSRADAHIERAVAALRERNLLTAEQELRAALLLNDSSLARRLLAENTDAPLSLQQSTRIGSPAVAVASDGNHRALIAGEGGDLYVVNGVTGSIEWSHETGEGVRSTDWNAKTDRIAVGMESGRLIVLDRREKRTAWSADLDVSILGVRYSSSGNHLAVGLADGGGIAVFQSDGAEILRIDTHAGSVQGLEFNDEGTHVYWGGSSPWVWACELGGGCQRVSGVEEWVYSIAGSSTGRFTAIATGDQVRLFDHHMQHDEVLKGHSSHVYGVSFSADERHLYSVGADGEVRVWDPRTGLLLQTVEAAENEIYSADAVGVGHLVTADRSGAVQIWASSSVDVPMPTHPFQPLPGMMARHQRNQVVDITPERSGLLVTTWDGERRPVALPQALRGATGEGQRGAALRQLAEWRARSSVRVPVPFRLNLAQLWTGSPLPRRDLVDLIEQPSLHALSPDGARLATVRNDGTWSIEFEKSEPILGNHAVTGPSAAAFVNATTLVIGGEGGAVQLVGSATPRFLREPTNDNGLVHHLLVYPDQRRVLVADHDGTLQSIDMDRNESLFRTKFPGLTSVAFSPDGTLLAVAGITGTIDLVDPQTGTVRANLRRHGGQINVVGFVAGGRMLVSGGFDETVRFWNAQRITELLSPRAPS